MTQNTTHHEATAPSPRKVLIVGIAGGYGRLLARRLMRSYDVVGADREPISARLPDVPFYRVDPRKRSFEDVFRRERPDAVVHIGTDRSFRGNADTRYDINLRGTRKLLDHCENYGVRRLIVLSTSYVYGALPENPQFMDEEQPLAGSRHYPEIRDLIEVDSLASAFVWRHPELAVSVLRPVSALGETLDSAMSRFFRSRFVVLPMGFNPMFQLIHEEDLSDAIGRALDRNLRGVYNIEGSGEVPIRIAVREAGSRFYNVPDFLMRRLSRPVMGMPPGAIDFLKYPCTVDGSRFRDKTGFEPRFGLKETLQTLRRLRSN